MQDVTGVTTTSYDNAGRPVGVVHGVGKALTYTLDPNGNRLGMVDPSGGLTTYAHDANNRLTQIVNPFGERTTITHDALERESVKVLGNGMEHRHTYDPAGRETLLRVLKSDGTALRAFTSTYDSVGNRLTVLELDGVRVTYAYDEAYQLTNEQRSGGNAYNITYAYDSVGNRTQKNSSGQVTAYQCNAANELTLVTPPSGAPTTVSYDENGNTLVENTGGALTTYTWSDENKLTAIVEPDASRHTFTYAADGLRRKKVTPTETRNFILDGVLVLQELDAALARVAQYTDSPGYWGGLVSQRRDSTSSFYGFDLQGSARFLVSLAQAITDAYLDTAFGEDVASSGSSVNAYRYGGLYRYYRDAADRQQVGQRILRPGWGRWLSRDPLGSGANWYRYAQANPVIFIDPSGERPVVPSDPHFPKPPPHSRWEQCKGYLCVLRHGWCINGQKNAAFTVVNTPPASALPGANGGPRDAVRHCVWACLVQRNCGSTAYQCGVVDHENDSAGWAKGAWDPTYSPMDLGNDAIGSGLAGKRGTCKDLCLAEEAAGNLYILPRQYWSVP